MRPPISTAPPKNESPLTDCGMIIPVDSGAATMRRFKFDFDKGLEAILYVANRVAAPNFHKISKVLYFADLEHLERFGRFITGDRYIAMEYGPVPSDVNNILRCARGEPQYIDLKEEIKSAIEVPGRYTVKPLRPARTTVFSKSDLECLDDSITKYGPLSFGELVDKSHDAAWQATDEGQEMQLVAIIRMMNHADEILELLEITDERAA